MTVWFWIRAQRTGRRKSRKWRKRRRRRDKSQTGRRGWGWEGGEIEREMLIRSNQGKINGGILKAREADRGR